MSEGIVLAGGYSSRVKQNKMMLDFNGRPLIWHTVNSMKSVCTRVIIVTGHYHQEIAQYFRDYPEIEIIHNPEYAKGMFTSVKTGVNVVKTDFFLIPGDYPLVRLSTYKLMKDSPGTVKVATFKGRRGHPIWFDDSAISVILNEPDDSNLKEVRNRFLVTYVETDDCGVIKDIDTYEDYLNLKLEMEGDGFENK
ncbi:MAG: NTP transferase domain-containing protein [Bacilli bacterium]|nr:NTP transferase domain-containing protein [Bacilli bacterium]